MLGHRLTGFQALCRLEWHPAIRDALVFGVSGRGSTLAGCMLPTLIRSVPWELAVVQGARREVHLDRDLRKRSSWSRVEVKIMKGSDGGADPNKRLGMLKNMVCPSRQFTYFVVLHSCRMFGMCK